MADTFTVHLDDAAIYSLLNDIDGPVGVFLEELSEQAATVARTNVPIRKTRPWKSQLSTAFPPGYTLESIHTNVHYYKGMIYGGIASAELPTIFLEYPASQMHRKYPFMSTAFDSIIADLLA